MKVAFVPHAFSYTLPPYLGDSVAILTYETARCLARSCDVIIYNKGFTRFWKQPASYEGIRYRYVRVKPDRWLQTAANSLLKLFNIKSNLSIAGWYYGFYALQIALDLRWQKCDIVHIHNYSQIVPIVRAFNPNVRIVLHMHCEWLTQSDYATIEQRLSQTDLIIGCSSYITQKIQQRFPQFADRCQTVFNGVDTEIFSPLSPLASAANRREAAALPAPTSQPAPTSESTSESIPKAHKLLFVGRISPEKGVHVLLDAFAEVVRRYPNTQLDLVGAVGALDFKAIVGVSDDPLVLKLAEFYQGDADYYTHLQARIPANIADQIKFHPPVPHEQVVEYYRQADILINPSLSEAFGMSLVEAMATATPVIGSRIGGMTDVIRDAETGLLVEPANPISLAVAMLKLLGNESFRQQIGQRGRQWVIEQCSWQRIAESLMVHYRYLCT